MISKTIRGDLLDLFAKKEFDAILHGCNCFNTMGAGIAKQIAQIYPEALEADKQWGEKGDIFKIGSFSQVNTKHGIIFNCYTQYYPGPYFEYSALINCISLLQDSDIIYQKPTVIGIPKIGAGIGGGKWQVIQSILEESSLNFILVEYDGGIQNLGTESSN